MKYKPAGNEIPHSGRAPSAHRRAPRRSAEPQWLSRRAADPTDVSISATSPAQLKTENVRGHTAIKFLEIAALAGSGELLRAVHQLNERLAPYRRAEASLLDDLVDEYSSLSTSLALTDRKQLMEGLARYQSKKVAVRGWNCRGSTKRASANLSGLCDRVDSGDLGQPPSFTDPSCRPAKFPLCSTCRGLRPDRLQLRCARWWGALRNIRRSGRVRISRHRTLVGHSSPGRAASPRIA